MHRWLSLSFLHDMYVSLGLLAACFLCERTGGTGGTGGALGAENDVGELLK